MSRNAVSLCALPVVFVCMLLPAATAAEPVKARVLEVNERRSEVRVDMAGQSRTYRVDDRGLFRASGKVERATPL